MANYGICRSVELHFHYEAARLALWSPIELLYRKGGRLSICLALSLALGGFGSIPDLAASD